MSVGEFQANIRVTIPAIVEHLKDPRSDVCEAALEGVSRMATQGMC